MKKQTKREQADEIVIDAFEAHLSEITVGSPFDRRVTAVARLRDEVRALAAEKGINPRTLQAAFLRLRGRALTGTEVR